MNLNTEQYFSTVPQIHIPRSVFDRSFTLKTTFNVNKLVPIFVDEVLPGDSMKLNFTAFGRLLNPLVVPVMDELYFETLWFQCPSRLLWTHWVNMCGEQDNPNDTIDYICPTINSGENGFAVGSIFDMMGIPAGVPNLEVNSLPLRMYNLTYNQWFRDENLINSVTVAKGDSDSASNYTLLKSSKIHDYFTSCLPFSQKFGDSVNIPISPISAGIVPNGNMTFDILNSQGVSPDDGTNQPLYLNNIIHSGSNANQMYLSGVKYHTTTGDGAPSLNSGFYTLKYNSGLGLDLLNSAGASVSDFRFAIKLQQYRELQARSGSRYIEYLKANYGVNAGDYRLQRVEFLGSTREMIDINTVVQTSATSSTSPQGNLTAYGVVANHGAGFSTSATEHGYLMGIARIRHNPVYQQGLNKMWKRSALLDFYNPIFNGISEQPVHNYELVAQGGSVLNDSGTPVDNDAFGFQEAWAEYRYKPSMICGVLRSGVTQSLDCYHLAQYFTDSNGDVEVPLLNQSFIEESIPMDRVLALNEDDSTSDNLHPQFIFDFDFQYTCARPMPVRNIPDGLCPRL